MIVIYKITNKLNSKLYVVQTNQPIEKRFLQHSKADSPLGNAMRDYGIENFTIEVVEECKTQKQANTCERNLIQELDCKEPNGYNRSDGGERGDFYCRRKTDSDCPPQVVKSTLDLLVEENNLTAEDKTFIESFLGLSTHYRAILRETCSAFNLCNAIRQMVSATVAIQKSRQVPAK